MIWSAALKTFFQSYSRYENITRTAQISQLCDAHVPNNTFYLWRYKAIVTLSSRRLLTRIPASCFHAAICTGGPLLRSRITLTRVTVAKWKPSFIQSMPKVLLPVRPPMIRKVQTMVNLVGRRYLDMKKPFLFIPTLMALYSYQSCVRQAIAVGGPFDCPLIIELVNSG